MFDTVSLVKCCRKLVSNELCLSAGPLPEDMIRTGLPSGGWARAHNAGPTGGAFWWVMYVFPMRSVQQVCGGVCRCVA